MSSTVGRYWKQTAVIDRLLVDMVRLTTPELMAGLHRLQNHPRSDGFECVFSAVEHVLLARGEGLRLLPEEWHK